MKRKVVLFYPRYHSPSLGAPLCPLSLAAPLLRTGFEVVIVDAALEMADVDACERASSERELPYAINVGCTYACNYGTDVVTAQPLTREGAEAC